MQWPVTAVSPKTKSFLVVLIAASLATVLSARPSLAQADAGGDTRPPRPPVDVVLDANGDGIIDAAEIANAPVALKKLDKNGDGKLTRDELRPERPDGSARQGSARPPSAPGDGRRPGRPRPPIEAALDANGDGVIDAAEIANAPAALKKLDKNGDGRLTPEEYRPPRPAGDPATPPARKGPEPPR